MYIVSNVCTMDILLIFEEYKVYDIYSIVYKRKKDYLS